MDETYRLCYVKDDWAWFTTQPLAQQWGDDWNDAPYECNASTPYQWKEGRGPRWEIGKVAYDGPFETPASYAFNSSYSVGMINDGAIPWLQTDRYCLTDGPPVVRIMAGITYPEFVRLILEGGGMVYAPVA